MSHAYGSEDAGVADGRSFADNLQTVDSAVFGRSSNVYGLLDTPMPAAYFGGLSMAVRTATGREVESYVAQLQTIDAARVEPIAKTYGRELRSRYFNPAWIKAMQASGYDGARHMAELADNQLLWSVTSPKLVTDADWNELHEVYVRDRYQLGLQAYFERENPAARKQMLASMVEAAERGRWRASAAVLAELRAALGSAKAPRAPGQAGNTGQPVRGFEMIDVSPRAQNQYGQASLWISLLGIACALALIALGASRRARW
jgi:cobaltochelatase CobN